jgi:predicted SprT family Zn-dependent metalloprotease
MTKAQKKVAATKKRAPTMAQFAAFQAMFAHFNRTLFRGELPPVFLNFSRHFSARTLAFYAPKRWTLADGSNVIIDEISLNPRYLDSTAPRDYAAAFVHELVHMWQHHFGTPSGSYHNREWSQKMLDVGLEPLDAKTGQPSMSAPRMGHRVVEGSRFAGAFERLPSAALLPWSCVEAHVGNPRKDDGEGKNGEEGEGEERAPKSRNKVKFTCPVCECNAWGKPGLRLLCDNGHAPARLTSDADEDEDEDEGNADLARAA